MPDCKHITRPLQYINQQHEYPLLFLILLSQVLILHHAKEPYHLQCEHILNHRHLNQVVFLYQCTDQIHHRNQLLFVLFGWIILFPVDVVVIVLLLPVFSE